MSKKEESFLSEHLKELRSRLIKICLAVFAGCLLCWFFGSWILDMVRRPIAPFLTSTEGQLIVLSPLEKFLSYLKVCLFAGVFVSCPYWLFQIWKFIAPGLYKNERYWGRIFIGVGSVLFFCGGAFVYFVVYPLAFRFLINFGGDELPFISLKEYLSFFIRTSLVFAFVFEIPLLLSILIKVNILTVEQLKASRRYAIVLIAILSALITPPDIVSMLLMMVPLYLLFELSLLIGKRI